MADEGNLPTVGHDDAYSLCGIEVVLREAIDTAQQVGHELGLDDGLMGFIGLMGLMGLISPIGLIS